jgi:hypothetical protein
MLLRLGAFAIAITFILAISLPARSDDPTDGTWLLDVGASKFNPVPGPQSQARIYQAGGKTMGWVPDQRFFRCAARMCEVTFGRAG